jgi:NADPH:quinone reductase-like Zn-dependent oxidoreductase
MASQSFRKLICHTLGTNFRQCTKIVTAQLPAPAAGTVIVRNQICGVNASDVNYTNGVYAPGVQPPFDTGFEAVGRVERCGEGVTKVKEGDYVVFSAFGAFSERMVLDARAAVPIPKPAPEALSVIVSGLTASIALQHIGKMQPGQKVVVTAAAGATGSYAVQLARLAGCEVIGTCSSDEKAEALRKLGCHRPINYKKENLFETLRKEYPKGVDLVYESVGGQVFDACINNLATHGKLIVIGAMSGYQDASAWSGSPAGKASRPIATKLLAKSASMHGTSHSQKSSVSDFI